MNRTKIICLLSVFLSGLWLGGCPAWFDDPDQSSSDGGQDGQTDAFDGQSDGEDGVEDLAELLTPRREAGNMPALGAAVFQGGQLVALGVVGDRVYQGSTAAQKDDLFHLGSCTKAMTATLTASLEARGLITWDTTLAEAFPEISNIHPDYEAVTLAQLLAHRGGTWTSIPDHSDAWNTLWSDHGPLPELRLWFAQHMLSQAPELAPGSEYAYSNAGYMIVGAALEQAGGESWEELLRQEVFFPLEMDSCGFGPPGSPGEQDQPWGHMEANGTWQSFAPDAFAADNPPALGPAGTVHCSMRDWGKFAQAHLAGAQGDESFLPSESFARMHTRWPGQDYALGWGVGYRAWADGDTLVHAGSNLRWFATVWLAPERDTAMLAVTNCDSELVRQELDGVFIDLLPLYLP